MSQETSVTEFSLPVEFDSHVKEGIGLPPKIVLEFKTQYHKVISIKRAGEAVSLAGRIVPIPASYHDRSVVVLPEKWEKAYDIAPTTVMCRLTEPSFANAIELKRVDTKKEKSLPVIIERIEDKTVIFKDQYVREDEVICRIESIDKDTSEAIATENTVLKDPNGKQISVGNENRKGSLRGGPTIKGEKISFENLHKIKGIDKTIERLKNEAIYPFIDILNGKVSKPMGGVLLYGPPGCGKTAIANAIAKDLGLYFDPIQIGELASIWVHQFGKNLKARFDRAAKAEGGAIIFLDELDAIAGHRSEMHHTHDKENVNVLLQVLDPTNRSPKVLVFAATNYLSSLDTAVTRSGRFDIKIGIGPPDEAGRAAILQSKLNNHSIDSKSITEGVVQDIARKTIGYVGADIETLVDKTDIFRKTRERDRDQGESTTSLPITKDDLYNGMQAVTPLCKTEMNIEQPSIQKDHLPGSENYIEQICAEAALMFHPEKFRSDIKVKPNQAFLLNGPPGTGKTSIANAVANELNILFQVINAGELKGSLEGQTIKNINKLFENARLFRPILLFFDEIDSIAQHRSSSERSSASDSINTLLAQFGDTVDNKNIIFIGATNRKDIIDPALLRPGRFGTHIEVGRPKKPNLKKQLNHQLEQIPHQLSKEDIDTLANLLYKKESTQSDIADFLNSVKRHLVFHTDKGDKADYSLFESILNA